MNANDRPLQRAAAVNCDADNASLGAETDSFLVVEGSAPGRIAPHHRVMLERAGVPLEFALEHGVFSASVRADLPGSLQFHATALPGLVFPWRGPDRRVDHQLRPDTPAGADGTSKYLQPADVRLLNVMPGSEAPVRVLIVEGTKQCLAARAYAASDELVVGIPGCANAMKDGRLLPGLDDLVDGLPVVLFFDADLSTKPQVRQSAFALQVEVLMEGATSCTFACVPGTGSEGLDDLLGGRSVGKRKKLLARLVVQAESDLPREIRQVPDVVLGRPTVDVSSDRLLVIAETQRYLLDRYDGERLFDHGGVISEFMDGRMQPVSKDRFPNYLAEAIYFHTVDPKGRSKPAWPDTKVIGAVWTAVNAFTPLEQLTTVPFVRPDGSICQQDGYDAVTKSLLQLAPDLQDVSVCVSPSRNDIQEAVRLLLDDWFVDMPLAEPAGRANLLALILTPFIRRLVPLVPMAVIDGLMMGVGKNLLADCLAIVVTGNNLDPLPFSSDDDELRKLITSHYGTGASMFVFDEAHVLRGPSLARALTAVEYTDRILGHSRMGRYTNVATWMALGNQVLVQGDLSRRVYRIALRPNQASPEQRRATSFKHADLRSWTRENRPRLIEAILTLVRAWFNAGQPPAPVTIGFGSFEAWQQIAGGIVEFAGVPDFLGNMLTWRSESDFETAYWQDHLNDVALHFPAGSRFTIKRVVASMDDNVITEFPPGLYNDGALDYARQLGQAYFRVKDRWFGDIRIVRDGQGGLNGASGRVSAWRLERKHSAPTTPTKGSEGSEGPGNTQKHKEISRPPQRVVPRNREAAATQDDGGQGPSCPSGPSPRRPAPVCLDDPSEADRRSRRSMSIATAMTARGLLLDETKLDQALAALRRGRQQALSVLVNDFGFPAVRGDGTTSSQPWLTTTGQALLAKLTEASQWPAKNGKPSVTVEALQQVLTGESGDRLVTLAGALLDLQRDHFVFALDKHRRNGRVHPRYTCDTATGRWAATEPNVLGAGRQTPALLAQRSLLVAEPGEVFIGVDLDGIDARAVAGLSGDREYAKLMRPGVDVHSEVSQLFFRTSERRSEAKAITHGLAYGRGAPDIATKTQLPLSYVENCIARFNCSYPGIKTWRSNVAALALSGPVPTGTGRKVPVDKAAAWTKGPGRVAQAAAHDIAVTGLLRVVDAGYQDRIALFLHDEVILSVPPQEAEEAATHIAALMSYDWKSPSGLVVPITASPHQFTGPAWSDLYRL